MANHDGNISFKLNADISDGSQWKSQGLPDQNLYLVTPTSFSKADVTAEDLLIVSDSGPSAKADVQAQTGYTQVGHKILEGRHKIFSEWSWHSLIYSACDDLKKDIKCVVHAHPPVATAFSVAKREIGTPALPEAIVSLGAPIKTLEFYAPAAASPGHTDFLEVKNSIKAALSEADAFLIPGNGVWAVGQDIVQTYLRVELVENLARIHLDAESLGGIKALPVNLVAELLSKRPGRVTTQTGVQDTTATVAVSAIGHNLIRDLITKELQNLKISN